MENRAPDTFISVSEINLSGENRLNSTVSLNWFGADPDGVVLSYDLSIDGGKSWWNTKAEDSTFIFSITENSDTIDIEFAVRAIDDEGLEDPEPAYLTIPIKNTPPNVMFEGNLMPQDTVWGVASISWNLSDADGDETIREVLIKLNDGEWYSVDRSQNFVSLIADDPSQSGSSNARIYYGIGEPEAELIQDIRVNDLNTVYVKAIDIAGSESEVDTANAFFLKSVDSDLLVIAAHDGAKSFYVNNLNATYPNYDLIDYYVDNGKNQPKYWNPTFNLLIKLYDKLLIFTENSLFEDAQTGSEQLILEAAAPALQGYLDANGKAWVNAIFPKDFPENSALFETLPMESISQSSSGYAILNPDSLILPANSSYDTLQPSRIITGLDPFYLTADAEALYRGQLEIRPPWTGPDVIAARRLRNNKVVQVFFSVELQKLNGRPGAMTNLFDQILNSDFNW
jgi:hypothetical protein